MANITMERSGYRVDYRILLFSIVAFTFSVYVLRAARKAYSGPIASIPGPWYGRWTDLPLKYYWIRGQRVKWIHGLHRKYGPIVRVRPNEISIVDLQSAREIHRISTPFMKTEWYLDLTGNQPQDLFSYLDPKAHSARRRLLATPLSESSLKNLEPTVNKNIDKAINGISLEMKNSGTVDIFKWFLFMATDVIGELSFAESFRMLDQGKSNEYVLDLQAVSLATALRTELRLITRVLGMLKIKPFSRVFESVLRFRQYSQQSFKRYEQHVAMNPTDPKPTLFTKMIHKVEGEESLPRDQLIREGQTYIIAGSDTTAVVTTYLVYAITRHPEVQEKLVTELSSLPSNFGWDHVRSLPYLNRCLDESMRLYGAVEGALPRAVPEGGAHLAGYEIPEGFTVSTQAYTLHRDPYIFPEPDRFNPDRWESPTQQMQQSIMAFGGGSRICIGLHLARAEMRMAVAHFFRTFPRARVLTSDEDMEPKSYFINQLPKKSCIVAA